MTKRHLLILLCAAAALSLGGCRSSRKPGESSAIASEMEASFRQRWIDRRAAELAQSGKAADVARAQAEKEFGERFDFSKPGQRKPAAK